MSDGEVVATRAPFELQVPPCFRLRRRWVSSIWRFVSIFQILGASRTDRLTAHLELCLCTVVDALGHKSLKLDYFKLPWTSPKACVDKFCPSFTRVKKS